MNDLDKNNYFFLNRNSAWPGFESSGLELAADGTLRLLPVPLLRGGVPDEMRGAATPDGPSGMAIDGLGNIFFSDTGNNRVLRIAHCDGKPGVVPCIGGTGSRPTQLHAPRGLAVHAGKNALFVADSGNHRIQVFDLRTYQMLEVWGQATAAGTPKAGSAPGQFNTPWALASDRNGNIYVVDYGNQRVQKFNAIGDVEPSFAQNASSLLKNPVDIAVSESCGEARIFVLDRSGVTATVYVFHADGSSALDEEGHALSIAGPELRNAMGMAACNQDLYVGDNTENRRRIYAYHFKKDKIEFAGEAIGYDGAVAALLLDGKGGLWVQAGGEANPILLSARAGCRSQGALWNTIPVQVRNRKVNWHRLQAVIQPLAAHAHLDLFVYTTSKDDDRPLLQADTSNPFADPRWRPASFRADADITDLYIGGAEAKYLWIGVLFLSNGAAASPALSQLRVEFDHPTYDQYLPAIFRSQKECGDFLRRMLSLFESLNMEAEGEIDAIPALFDPKATPEKFLGWLAGCLGFELDENWDERRQRELIAEIFRLSGRRGTRAGLRESLRLLAGVNAVIEEPILHASWWALPAGESCCDNCAAHASNAGAPSGSETSILGWTTMLAPAQPQGAVVGTSCDLDQSHLITKDDFGSPLFTGVAHQFSVSVYRGQIMCADVLPRIQAVLEQEKPAHTAYQLCVIEPRIRVGYQSRVGIDTVVAGTSRSLSLGSGQPLGTETVLAGERLNRLGVETSVGLTSSLS